MSDTIDHELRTIRFERVLDATPDEVFDAWTLPAQVTRWWDPSGAPLVECTIDLRLQGSFRFVTANHAPPFQGTYAVIDRPRRLEFHAMVAPRPSTSTRS
ncbi:MAG: SRPBCC domain-containing protein [Deltaproteobacteria bacterium]|nr:SRPBCC domain-containing protein [Deltaproteobacteria bacterium]